MVNQAEKIARDTYEREGWSVIKGGTQDVIAGIPLWKASVLVAIYSLL